MIPAFVSSEAKRADEAIDVLATDGGFAVERVPPPELADRVRHAIQSGARRVLIAGGDGSIGTAASALCGTDCELAILPAGTLNHFAQHLGLPLDLKEAVRTALGSTTMAIDVGRVNGHVFLNTSSVGAYVSFVRTRDRLERRLGYRLASVLAAARILFRLRSVRVTVEVEGRPREYDTPLVFIGVGERELKAPALGARVPDGRGGLHVMVVRTRGGARMLALALSAAARGLRAIARTPAMDSFLVESLSIATRWRVATTRIAVDGEPISVALPLEYRLERATLRVVAGDSAAD